MIASEGNVTKGIGKGMDFEKGWSKNCMLTTIPKQQRACLHVGNSAVLAVWSPCHQYHNTTQGSPPSILQMTLFTCQQSCRGAIYRWLRGTDHTTNHGLYSTQSDQTTLQLLARKRWHTSLKQKQKASHATLKITSSVFKEEH